MCIGVWYVGDIVVNDIVDDIGWIVMCGGFGGFEIIILVDSDVN